MAGGGLESPLLKSLPHVTSKNLTFLPPRPASYFMAMCSSQAVCLRLGSSEVIDMHLAIMFVH